MDHGWREASMNPQARRISRRSLALGAALALGYIVTPLDENWAVAQQNETSAVAEKNGRGSGQGARSGTSDIRDAARLFSAAAVVAGRRELERLERETGAPIVIETVEMLERESAAAEAVDLARRSGSRGFFILIAKKERKLEVLASERYQRVLTDARRDAVRSAFFEGFRQRDYDLGLSRGLRAIAEILVTAQRSGDSAAEGFRRSEGSIPGAAGSAVDSALIVRNQVRLTLAGARAILGGAEAKARAMGLKVNVAVVDDGGHLLAFERMDGARPASAYTALTKATTAATLRLPSGPLPAGSTSPDLLLNLSLQNAAAASGGKITSLSGGVPVLVDGQVIGGVGVGGGTGEQDAQIARAGIQAFSDQLSVPKPDSRTSAGSPTEGPGTNARDRQSSRP
jgi:glc operon protein GlcG